MRTSNKKFSGLILLSGLLTVVSAIAMLFALPHGAVVLADEGEEKTTYVLHDCDTTDGIKGLRHIDRDSFMQGSGCLYSINAPCSITASFKPVNSELLPAFEDAYLEFWLWIDDISNLGNDQCYFRLMNTLDVENYAISYRFNEAVSDISSGWNFMSFKLTDFTQVNPLKTFDYGKLSGFVVQAWPRWRPIAIRIDNVCITDKSSLDEMLGANVKPQTSKPADIELTVMREVYESDGDNAKNIVAIVLYALAGTAVIGTAAYAIVMSVCSNKKTKTEEQ